MNVSIECGWRAPKILFSSAMSPFNDFHCFAILCRSSAEVHQVSRHIPILRHGQPYLSYDPVRNWITTEASHTY
jgi:hypothetical protein